MRLARAQFTIRSLMGVVAVSAVLVGGVILLLRYSAATPPPLPAPAPGGVIMEGVIRERQILPKGVIMEGVDINYPPIREGRVLPRDLWPSEFQDGRRF